ncbi:MAG: LytTR family DNA-binding domain-containing protein [Spirosomataceae bacterium]
MNSHTCIIVDDNELDRLVATSLARKYPILEIIGVYASAVEALEAIKSQPVEVVLSDIDMPELSGIELRTLMRHIPVCIFITAYPDYAAESFDVEAFDFLVKPLKAARFEQTMLRLQHYFELKHKAQLFEMSLGADTIFIKDGHEQIKLKLHDVIYLEALKDYTRIVTKAGKYSVLASIGNLLQDVVFRSFVRIHRSYAVQRHFIERISPYDVQIQGYVLPIGRTYKEALSQLK